MVNKVILVGNVGKEPDVRYIESGVAVASFSLATSETYLAKNGEKVTNTEWHNIVAWRGLAELASKYINKGKQIYVEGRLRTRSYEQDGVKKYITEIVADTIQLLGRKDDTAQSNGSTQDNNYPKNEQAPDTANKMEADEPTDDFQF